MNYYDALFTHVDLWVREHAPILGLSFGPMGCSVEYDETATEEQKEEVNAFILQLKNGLGTMWETKLEEVQTNYPLAE